MVNQQKSKFTKLFQSLLVLGLILTLVLGDTSSALAARSGGRIGGGSFRSPSRSYSTPRSGYRSPGGGYGGGMGFPFLIPFFGFGGFGSLFTLLIFIAIANFLVRSFQSVASGQGSSVMGYSNPPISVAQIKVGLLANARNLQQELDQLGRTADTGSAAGRAMVLQEATLALLRHPEYWVYGSTESQQAALETAEAKFNQLSLTERSKFTEETLSNVNSQLRQGTRQSLPGGNGELAVKESGEYIVVTILVGTMDKLKLPAINDADNLRQALQQIGGIASDRLLAVEVLWTPQAEGDTLTTDDILAEYPNLKLV